HVPPRPEGGRGDAAMRRLTTCPDAESAAQRAAQEVLRHLEEARMQGRTPHVALSGGGTPKRTYELLAREPEHWAEAEVWFADERCVPPEDEESNYRLAALALLDPAGIPAERVHRMEGELGPERAALRSARRCLLLATGAAKADAISAMLAEPTPSVPASLLVRERLTVVVDDAAAPTGAVR